MKTTSRFIFNTIATILVGAILLFALLNFFSGPDKQGLFGYKGFIVLSDSMNPEFAAGDYVIDQLSPFDQSQVGDILTYSDETQNIVTHRVAEVTPAGLVLKGDGNDFVDTTIVTQENYIGKQRYVIPKLGSLMVKLSQPLALVAISLLFLGILIYQQFRKN